MEQARGCFRIRAKAGRHPQVVAALREEGQRWRARRHKPLQAIPAKRPTRQRVARVVRGQGDAHPRCLRLRIRGNRQTQECWYLVTNLPAKRSHLAMIGRAYPWRGHVALRWQAWQAYAHRHAVDTPKPAIVEGVMWAAMAAAARKRFVAPMTPLLLEVPMSTRQVAMGAVHVLGGMLQALQAGDMAGLYDALEAARTSLAGHAQRAHPQRDRHTGRSQRDLEPLLGSDDVLEVAEAA